MQTDLTAISAALEQQLFTLLQDHPQGISEFELLRRLQQGGQQAFDENLFKDNLAMYRAHFLLFHALYRLHTRLVAEGRARLEIHVLGIRLLPWQAANGKDLATPDPMRDYYLNLSNMQDTSAADVEQLLGAFWSRYFAQQRRAGALAIFGLEEPASAAQIETRYRRLAMRLHPDRGGNKADFQALQAAWTILRQSMPAAPARRPQKP